MAAAAKYRPDMCNTVIQLLADGESLAAVCDELDICRATLYEWRNSNPEFASAIARGLQKAQRNWERIGRQGVLGELEQFSATTWIFTMKNRFREDYAEEKADKGAAETLVDKLIDKLCD